MKQLFNKLCLWGSLFLLLMVSASNAEEKEVAWKPARPFTAELVVFNRHHHKLEKKSRIQMGENGMRITNLATGSETPFLTTIQNFQTGQSWIVSPGKLYYAELPVTDQSQDSAPVEGVDDLPIIGVLSNKPCQGMVGQKLDERELKGTRLTVWKCKLVESGETYLQHYSSLLGVVVRQESSEGHTLELRNIKLDSPGAAEFTPSELWREVTLEEFFTGAPVLPDYQPTAR